MVAGYKHIYAFFSLLGVCLGLSAFTFFYAQGTSYFFDDPKTCMNCHIMREHFDAWNRSTHKSGTTCNDCHTPKNIIGKYAVKGINGWNHSAAFTLGNFHEPIQIRPFNRRITLDNCIRCHGDMASRMTRFAGPESVDCLRCHRNTGHGNKL